MKTNVLYGGESGIRYLDVLLESVSYRFQVAARPIFAIRSTDHCTLLHAGFDSICVDALESSADRVPMVMQTINRARHSYPQAFAFKHIPYCMELPV